MKKTFSVFLIILGLHLFAFSVFAQSPGPTPRIRTRPYRSGTGEGNENSRRTVQATAASEDAEEAVPNLRPLSSIRKEIREKLKLSDDEKDNYRKLAGDKKANVVRVISSFSCSTSLVVDLSDPRCSDNPDYSIVSYYSFRFRDFGESPWTDVSFIEDELTAGNKWQTAGFLADLGDAAEFGRLDSKSEEVKALWEFKEAVTVDEKSKQREELEKGFSFGNLFLGNKMKMLLNHTYLVRTISYRVENSFRGFGPGFSWHNTDSLFIFKVVGLDDDRTVTLAWKKIFQKIAPVLEEKKEKKDKDGK